MDRSSSFINELTQDTMPPLSKWRIDPDYPQDFESAMLPTPVEKKARGGFISKFFGSKGGPSVLLERFFPSGLFVYVSWYSFRKIESANTNRQNMSALYTIHNLAVGACL